MPEASASPEAKASCTTMDNNWALEVSNLPLAGEIQKGMGGRGRDRECHKLSQVVVTFYDEFL